MLAYIDNCCFNRPFDDQSQMRVRLETEAKLSIQAEVRSGKIELAWSYILDYENDANPNEERKESIERWRRLARVDTTETSAIVAAAEDFCSRGLKKKDSLHLASAVVLDCEIFFTTDDGLLKKRRTISEIKILNPIEYYADYND